MKAERMELRHDLPARHPRVGSFERLAEAIHDRSAGRMTLALVRHGAEISTEQDLKDVIDGKLAFGCLNNSWLEEIEPRCGFVSLPFGLPQDVATSPATATRVTATLDELIAPHGIRVLGTMWATDQLLVFPSATPGGPRQMSGLRIRTNGKGIPARTIEALRATPVSSSIGSLSEALSRGEFDGVCTSPGGWATVGWPATKAALYVPGMTVMIYPLISSSEFVDQLGKPDLEVLRSSARDCLTLQWGAMIEADEAIVRGRVADGATYRRVEGSELTEWQQASASVAAAFYEKYPEMRKHRLSPA